MNSVSSTCQNCKTQFTIEPEDFQFYEKIKVPPPTWCPECRMIRRMTYRNERTLYKDTCKLCGASIISQYDPKANLVVYCSDCYVSDKWDRLSYGRPYDFLKPFFQQFRELMQAVPRRALYIDFAVNSPHTNQAVHLKNCYLVFGGHHYEDSSYSSNSIYLTDCMDVEFSKKCEQCYYSFHLRQCNRVCFSSYSEECSDSRFLYDCRNCTRCFACAGLRNKKYCIFNRQYSKEEYEQKLKEYDTGSFLKLTSLAQQFNTYKLKHLHKYAWVRNIANSIGDDLERVKDCIRCFSATEAENCRYSFFIPTGAKDSYDLDHVGVGTELAYELVSGWGDSRVVFGSRVYDSHDVAYGDDCYSSSNLFGCISLRSNEYCILNKQYSKEEYEAMVSRIIQHMNEMPYIDKKSRVYKYGEFFPPELSPFAYNETIAQEYFPLTKDEAITQGYRWRDPELRNYSITKLPQDLPDHIKDVPDSIVNEIIQCTHNQTCNEQCTQAFKIIPQELQFYRRMSLPLPRLCPNCRHYQRLKQRNPLKLWHRSCQCAGSQSERGAYTNTIGHLHGGEKCPNEFETSYTPDRKEIVYCEQCYNAEVV